MEMKNSIAELIEQFRQINTELCKLREMENDLLKRENDILALLKEKMSPVKPAPVKSPCPIPVDIKTGDRVHFGSYPQTAKGEDRTPIEWRVLERNSNHVLLLSETGLDTISYNNTLEKVTWEECALREWLNGVFLNTAFSEQERNWIMTAVVSPDRNPDFETDSGYAAQDKVFLLSAPETNRYFSNDKDRMCEPTDYAVARGAYTTGINGKRVCWWWLRSPGNSQEFATFVSYQGKDILDGSCVSNAHGCVRPALWINLE